MPKHKKKKPQQSSESSTAAVQSEQPSKARAEESQQPSNPQAEPSVQSSGDGGKKGKGKGKGKGSGQQQTRQEPTPPTQVGGGDTGGKTQDGKAMGRTGVPPAQPPAQQRVPPPQQQPPAQQRVPPPQQQPPAQQRVPPPQQQPPAQQRVPPPQQQPPAQQRVPPPQQQPPAQQRVPPQPQPSQQRVPPPEKQAPPPSRGNKAAAFPIPCRASLKQSGTEGRRIVVETNHLALDLTGLRSKLAYHYDVAIDPDKPKRLLRYAVEEFRLKHFKNRYPAFDGRKNLVSASPLPFNDEISDTVTVCDEENPNRNKEFKVTIKRVATVDLTSLKGYMEAATPIDIPQTAMQMIDIVLRNAPAMSFVPVGRSYFTPPAGRIVSLGDGMDMWYGLYQSVNLGWLPFVNVDVAHKAFPTSQNVIQAIKELCGDFRSGEINLQQELSDFQKEEFRKYIKRLKVDYMIPNQPQTKRTYRVNDIAPSSSRLMFSLENGQRISVLDYFRSVKGVHLQYPNMPCLHVGSPNRPNPIYLPAEFCTITHKQVVNRQMNEKQTSNMIRNAATSTSERKRKIMEAKLRFHGNRYMTGSESSGDPETNVNSADVSQIHDTNLPTNDSKKTFGNHEHVFIHKEDHLGKVGFNQHPAVREFGLKVSETFTQVPARILPPPQLTYKEERNQTPMKGVWRPSEFFKGMTLINWAILCLDGRTREDDISKAVNDLKRAGGGLGMDIRPPQPVTYLKPPVKNPRYPADFNRAKEKIISYFKENKEKNMQLILVIVPDKGESYANVKQTAELNVGVLTQCIKARTISRMNPATASNILLKVNSKLNGINHKLANSIRPVCLQTPAMLVGADVTHPSPQQTNIPSVAAVCASHDPNGFLYNIEFRLQSAREEIIRDLQTIMRSHLMYFFIKTRNKPRRILFFRDGVSDGQFSQVISAELTAIRQACLSLDPEYKPAITFLVVQKRHHTRFFPTRQEDADGRNCNVPAGTIVDTQITHPRERDFYLVSHASIQGVSRPTKYHCLWDDNKFSDDELQKLTYFLCHMFSRCTRSVSYPAPTYYAHLAAYRARVYIEGREIQLDNLQHEQDMSKIKDYLTKDFPMFFV